MPHPRVPSSEPESADEERPPTPKTKSNKRAASVIEIDESSDVPQKASKKRKKDKYKRTAADDQLIRAARAFPRSVRAFLNPSTVIGFMARERALEAAGEDSSAAASTDTGMSADDRLVYTQAFDGLVRFAPNLPQRMETECDMPSFAALLSEMDKEANSVQATDRRKIKTAMPELVPLDFKTAPLVPPVKSTGTMVDRGANHDQLARLICPVDDLEKFDDTALFDGIHAAKALLQNAEISITGDKFALYLYKDYKYDPDKPEKGLCCSSFIIQVGQIILTGLSSAGVDPSEKTIAKRSGNAKLFNITAVTKELIAYCCTIARTAIGDKSVWTGLDKEFDYAVSYNAILTHLSVRNDPYVKEAFALWNQAIFGNSAGSQTANAHDGNDRAKARRERQEQRIREAEEAQAATSIQSSTTSAPAPTSSAASLGPTVTTNAAEPASTSSTAPAPGPTSSTIALTTNDSEPALTSLTSPAPAFHSTSTFSPAVSSPPVASSSTLASSYTMPTSDCDHDSDLSDAPPSPKSAAVRSPTAATSASSKKGKGKQKAGAPAHSPDAAPTAAKKGRKKAAALAPANPRTARSSTASRRR
ncbi:hypothetical protein FA95DRAFT_1577872 [Auriscalpium vulgare]|uniref:Uncharacterized protein n=1 Tax=Auriscalpium vulgare TaxID=40419 RepID=A0ACB8R525_9AGAM|nr:hypothetical protein FA95DRAFT_1577872 [Auriscalpium vulgare]